MFDYQVSKHPHFDEACRAFALRHNLVQLAERAGMNVQILRNKLNPAQPHLLTAPEIWLLTDLTEDSTLVDGFLAQIHCLPCVPINEVAKEKLPHYVMSATAEIGRVAAGAVAEPHHDGTVHWHLMCFMRKKDRRAITALLRKFAIREDREELGNNTGPRFKSELINPRKGTPTSYLAKYISKNIDGRGLAGEISKETGKSLRDNAEYVNAWASLHRVQQFRFFGIPGRQAYRELRLLAGQAARQQGDKKAGAPVLDNPRLDAILAAADAGCFATYIMKQGGVLVPRKYHLIRTAYEINEEPTAYGDHGIRIYGIWSPIAEGKICTHAVKWKMVRKAVDVQEAAADQGACAPWTRGNNCPLAENLNQQGKDKSADGDSRTDITRMNDKELHNYLHSMSKKERRELAARLRQVKPKRRKDYKQRITDHQRQQLVYELKSRGFDGSEKEVDLLLRGGSIPSGAGLRIFYRNQRLKEDDKWRNLY